MVDEYISQVQSGQKRLYFDTLLQYHEQKVLIKEHLDKIIIHIIDRDMMPRIFTLPFIYDNETLKCIVAGRVHHVTGYDIGGHPRAYISQGVHIQMQDFVQLLDHMVENKIKITDCGAESFLCTHPILKIQKMTAYLNAFFDFGYVPSNVIITWLMLHKCKPHKLMVSIIKRFNLELTPEHAGYCKKNNLYVKPTEESVEDKFKLYKLADFIKQIPADAKLTQQCLYNACTIKNNLTSVKTLVKKYNLKLDTKCLECSTSVPDNVKMNSYLAGEVKVSSQCIINLADHGYVMRCDVFNVWKQQEHAVKDLDIAGIENI